MRVRRPGQPDRQPQLQASHGNLVVQVSPSSQLQLRNPGGLGEGLWQLDRQAQATSEGGAA